MRTGEMLFLFLFITDIKDVKRLSINRLLIEITDYQITVLFNRYSNLTVTYLIPFPPFDLCLFTSGMR